MFPQHKFLKTALFVMLGAVGGFAYYYFVGCTSGSCPISSNPYISSLYGSVMGLVLSFDEKKKQ